MKFITPYPIPALGDLLTRARQGFRTYLPGSDAWVWPNNIYASAKVLAGMAFECFGFAAYIARMIFASTAPDIETLRLHGNEFGIAQKPAEPASGNVTFAATDAIEVTTGALLERSDGAQYEVSAGGSLTGAGTLQVPAIALVDGATANAEAGTPLTILSGVNGPGDVTAAVGSGDIVGGADVEDIESFRARILFRKRNPPHGGAPSDYVLWAGSLSGVSRVYVERLWNGAGTVRVYPLFDDIFPDGIGDTTAIDRVASYLATVEPAGAIVTVQAPVATAINITIAGLTPDNTATREAVLAELRAAFRRLSRVAGGDTPHGGMPFLATPTSFDLAWVYQAVANAVGVTGFDLTAPATDTVILTGHMATLGTVTFV